MTRGSSTAEPVVDLGGERVDERVDSRVAALAGLPAGPELAAALAQLDVAKLSDWELVEVLRARYRQASHDRGQLFAVLCEVTRRWQEPAMLRPEDPAWAWASSEVAAALVLTRGAADALCGLAWDLEDRLPEVGKALAAGVLDEPRARVFSDWTTWLDTAHAQAIVAVLLPKAPRLTTAQLRREIAKHAIALDPTWAKRRYREAVRTRRVIGYRNETGTANLTGQDLPVDEVAAACDRLDRLARAAKAAGHPDRMDQLRADLFIRLVNGTYEGLTDSDILTSLLAGIDPIIEDCPYPPDRPAFDDPWYDDPWDDDPWDADAWHGPWPDDEDGPGPVAPWPDGPEPDDGSEGGPEPAGGVTPGDHDGPVPPRPRSDGGGSGEARAGDADGHRPSRGTGMSNQDSMAGDDAPPPMDPGHEPDDDAITTDGSRLAVAAAGGAARTATGIVGRSGGLRLLARLATVAGADARPGILAGWGPVHAELARTIATSPGARWWYVLANPDGSPAAIGRIRTRPNPTAVPQDADIDTVTGMPRRGRRPLEVWLQVTHDTLAELAAQPPPGWRPVLDEITTSLATNPTGPPNTNPMARLPGAALRRWLHVRDHTCVFPICGVPAHRSEADHTTEHANGGPTIDANLASACRPHHRLREAGWSVKQPTPGHVAWTSPSGHTYTRQPPESLDRLPDPMPHPPSATEPDNDYLPSEMDWRTDTCMTPEPAKPQPPPPPPPKPTPQPAPEDDIPPF